LSGADALPRVDEAEDKLRRTKQVKINNLKYDLMMLNQDLGRVVPSSRLSEEITSKMKTLQEEISKLEVELNAKTETKREPQEIAGIKKVQEGDGQVKIWSSSNSPK
jgi:hypothetical protein